MHTHILDSRDWTDYCGKMKCLTKTFNPYGAIKESLILDFNFEKNRFGLLFLEGQNGYIFGKKY